MNDDPNDVLQAMFEVTGGAEGLRPLPLPAVISEAMHEWAEDLAGRVLAWWQEHRAPLPADRVPPEPDWDELLRRSGRPVVNRERDAWIVAAKDRLLRPAPQSAAEAAAGKPAVALMQSERAASRLIAAFLTAQGIEVSAEAVRAVRGDLATINNLH